MVGLASTAVLGLYRRICTHNGDDPLSVQPAPDERGPKA